jgi:hypothetical protein
MIFCLIKTVVNKKRTHLSNLSPKTPQHTLKLRLCKIFFHNNIIIIIKYKFVTQSRTGLQIYEGLDNQLNRPGSMA